MPREIDGLLYLYRGRKMSVRDIADAENVTTAAIYARLRKTGSAHSNATQKTTGGTTRGEPVPYCGLMLKVPEAARLAGLSREGMYRRLREQGTLDVPEVVGVPIIEAEEAGLSIDDVQRELRAAFDRMKAAKKGGPDAA
jgi:hypothetical protein